MDKLKGSGATFSTSGKAWKSDSPTYRTAFKTRLKVGARHAKFLRADRKRKAREAEQP